MVFIVIFIDTGQPCLEHKSSLGVWSSGIEIACHSDNVAFHPLLTLQPTFPPPLQPSTQQPWRQIWQISIYGTCVAVACLIRSKQALICPPISVSPQHKFQVGNWFLSRVEGFAAISMPFICMCVCACVWVWVSACVHVCARRCMCTCLWPLSVCRWVWICVSVRVCRCYLCNWI